MLFSSLSRAIDGALHAASSSPSSHAWSSRTAARFGLCQSLPCSHLAQVLLAKVDIDQEPDLAGEHNVRMYSLLSHRVKLADFERAHCDCIQGRQARGAVQRCLGLYIWLCLSAFLILSARAAREGFHQRAAGLALCVSVMVHLPSIVRQRITPSPVSLRQQTDGPLCKRPVAPLARPVPRLLL